MASTASFYIYTNTHTHTHQQRRMQRHRNYVLSITKKARLSKPQQTYALRFSCMGMNETMPLHPIVWTVMQLHAQTRHIIIIINYRHYFAMNGRELSASKLKV